MRGLLGFILIATAMAFAGGAARAAEKVDCSHLDLAFAPADKADWSECYVRHYSEGAEEANAEVETLIADIGTHVVHITSVVAGRNTYFDKVPVSNKLSDYDELEDMRDVATEPGYDRYQIIRFRASLWKAETDCIGFLKYGGAMIAQGGNSYGARSYVAGYDCWRNGSPDRGQIEATLDAIDD
ncbi:hypothetical protein [Hypericibacter sp.]|uniref:hypothetical protein n=1 Tax=Hypericibacter sp. TaxID=2705401 RepID=UPI003D6DA509